MKNNLIIPYAKQSGVTSFSSMGIVKKLLNEKKIGHTGTLDNFADGLLVLVSNQFTRFAELISTGNKRYDVWVQFGAETDTLDIHGEITAKSGLPYAKKILQVLPQFIGHIQQIPPEFSAVKINGKRASDRIRNGEKIELKARTISIFNIQPITFLEENGNVIHDYNNKNIKVNNMRIKVECSKGTYIRSLVRDIASTLGVNAYVCALRRLSVGMFKLENAAGFDLLPEFSNLPNLLNTKIQQTITLSDINKSALTMNTDLANNLGLGSISILNKYVHNFFDGKKIQKYWFNLQELCEQKKYAVFDENQNCIGIILKANNNIRYESVFKK